MTRKTQLLKLVSVIALATPFAVLGACSQSTARPISTLDVYQNIENNPTGRVSTQVAAVREAEQDIVEIDTGVDISFDDMRREIEQAIAEVEIDLEAMELELEAAREAAQIDQEELARIVEQAQKAAQIDEEELERIIAQAQKAAEKATEQLERALEQMDFEYESYQDEGDEPN